MGPNGTRDRGRRRLTTRDGLLLLAALAAVVVAAVLIGRRPPPEPVPELPPGPPPNVLLVVYDTTRAEDMSVGTAPFTATPVFDQVADEGVWYAEARTVSAWTVPSHASLFTGLYPSRHGTNHNNTRVRESLTTLAELLAPTHDTAGFSENPHIARVNGYDQGFSRYDETWRHKRKGAVSPPTIKLAQSWLNLRTASGPAEKPFFLFVNLMDAHLPYQPPGEYVERVRPPGVGDSVLEAMRNFGGYAAWGVVAGQRQLSDQQYLALDTLHRGSVAYADARVGELMERLWTDGVLDDTLVILVADHGENIGDHGLMDHQFCLYETLLRVPLAMRLPGTFEGGRRIDTPVQLVDLLPTVADVAGVDPARRPEVDGTSLVGEGPAADRPVVAEYARPSATREPFLARHPGFDFDRLERALWSYQEGQHKLILSERGERELYDLLADPAEQANLEPVRPARADELQARLEQWRAAATPPAENGDPVVMDLETIKALRELGYVE